MEESIRDILGRIADVLKYFGKADDARLLWRIIVYLECHGITIPDDLEGGRMNEPET